MNIINQGDTVNFLQNDKNNELKQEDSDDNNNILKDLLERILK